MTASKLLREAWATARAGRAYSWFFGVIAFTVVVVVVLLSGQAAAQRAEVADTFNRAEYRTVEVIDDQGLDVIPWTAADLARRMTDVERAWTLSAAFEVTNAALPERGRVSARMLGGDWADLPIRLVNGRLPTGPAEALADESAAELLGLDPSGGALASVAGGQWAVVGTYAPLHARAPATVLVPRDEDAAVRSLSVTVSRLSQLDPVTTAVMSVTESTGPGQFVIDRSADAGRLDAAVTGTVGRHGVVIVVTTMATSAAVLALLSALMVHSRRQEFGRRRALGATRTTIVLLVVLQGATVVTAATLLGLAAATGVTWLRFGRGPDITLLAAILVTTVGGSALAQVPSAVAAGLRDPVRVLRTP